jgi:hypothetical protein
MHAYTSRSCRYWLYAAVAAGSNGLLISNDEMRDHVFQLLAPRYFYKWKQRHQSKYTFDSNGLMVSFQMMLNLFPNRIYLKDLHLPLCKNVFALLWFSGDCVHVSGVGIPNHPAAGPIAV